MKVAFFIPDMRGGGAERVALLLINQMVCLGHSVDLIVLRKEGELLEAIPESVNIVALGDGRVRNALFSLCKYLRSENPDHLIVSMWPLTTVSVVASQFAGYKGRLVLSEHNTLSLTPQALGKSGFLLRLCMRLVNHLKGEVVGVSQGVIDDLHLLGLPEKSGRVIHNPILMSEGTVLPDSWLSHPWVAEKDSWKILAVGSLKKQKDYPSLLKSVSLLKQKGVNVQLLILGQGDLDREIFRLCSELDIEDCVFLGGFVSDPAPFYRRADLFVLSSAWEGFGNVIVEALAVGTPVVSTDCKSGPAEILENGKYGKLVPVGDSAALATAIAESLSEPFDPEALKARAKDFSPEIIAKQYLELVQ